MQKNLKKLISMLLLCAMLFHGQATAPLYAFEASVFPQVMSRLTQDMTGIRIPAEMGEVQEVYLGSEKRSVVLIQDAHSIPEAQKSIQEILNFFQSQYGIDLTFMEGNASELDARVFRSFPDKKLLRKVFKNYMSQSELTGTTAAAIFNRAQSAYVGIEDWKLYESELEAFMKAIRGEEQTLERLSILFEDLQKAKQEHYSKELLQVDQAVVGFRHADMDLMKLLEVLSAFLKPNAGSRIEAMVQSLPDNDTGISIESEVKSLALRVQKLFLSMSPSPGMFSDQEIFNLEHQKFRTSQSTPEVFGVVLQKLIDKYRMPLEISEKLSQKAAYQKKIQEIKGTQLFRELETYIRNVKMKLFENDLQKRLDQESRYLDLIEDLTKLELSQEGWVSLTAFQKDREQWTMQAAEGIQMTSIQNLLENLEANFQFYEIARKRDHLFTKKTLKEMSKRQKTQALLVAGGFHTEGLTAELKSQGVSYVLVTPAIKKLPEKNNYRERMEGKVSWQKYFEIKNGRVDLYKAFVRGTRDLLLQQTKENQGVLLKKWRDQMIRDLAKDGEIEKASEYVVFLDEVSEENQGRMKLQEQWLTAIENFMEKMEFLDQKNELTEANVLKLLQPSLAAEAVLAVALAPRNEIRAVLLPAISQQSLQGARAELRSEDELIYSTNSPLQAGRIRVNEIVSDQGMIKFRNPSAIAKFREQNPTWEEISRGKETLFFPPKVFSEADQPLREVNQNQSTEELMKLMSGFSQRHHFKNKGLTQADIWSDGASSNARVRVAFEQALDAGGQNMQAHGMTKQATLEGALKALLSLLEDGVDPNRGGGFLETAPLVAKAGEGLSGATASGAAYVDGPFMLVQKPDADLLTGDLSGLGAILVNESISEMVDALRLVIQRTRPDIIVERYSQMESVVKQLKMRSELRAVNVEKTPAQSLEDREFVRYLKDENPGGIFVIQGTDIDGDAFWDAIKKGQTIVMDVMSFVDGEQKVLFEGERAKTKQNNEILESLEKNLYILAEKIAATINDKEGAYPEKGFYDSIGFILSELLKNAIYHGNRLDLSLPVAFTLSFTGQQLTGVEMFDHGISHGSKRFFYTTEKMSGKQTFRYMLELHTAFQLMNRKGELIKSITPQSYDPFRKEPREDFFDYDFVREIVDRPTLKINSISIKRSPRSELRSPDVQNTAAGQLLKTFELEDLQKYGLASQIMIDDREGPMDFNSSAGEKTTIVRSGLANIHAKGRLPKTGLEFLVEELFRKNQGRQIEAEILDVDLLYAADGRLLGIFPALTGEHQELMNDKTIEEFFYFDLSEYYLEIPAVGDPQGTPKWEAFSKQLKQDQKTIEAFLKKQKEDMGLEASAPYFSKSYNRQDHLHAPYVYLEVDQQTGSVSKARAFWPDKYDPSRYNEKREGYHQTILPIFPSVYSPGVDFNLASDLAYYDGIGSKLNLSPEDDVLVVFAGSGIDTLLAYYAMTKNLADPRSADIVIDVIDANPLAIANVQEVARLAGFEVNAIVNDNVFLEGSRDLVFGEKNYGAVLGNMPHVKRGVQTAFETLRARDLHDGDRGKTLNLFAEGLLYLLKPKGGRARIWNIAEREIAKILQTGGGIFDEGQGPLQVTWETSVATTANSRFVSAVYDVRMKRAELRSLLTEEDFLEISLAIADESLRKDLAEFVSNKRNTAETDANHLIQSVEEQGLEITKQNLKEAVVMSFLKSRQANAFVWTDEGLEVLRQEAQYLIASLQQLEDRSYTLAATLPESGDTLYPTLFKQLLKLSEDEKTFSELATNGALPVAIQKQFHNQEVRSRSVRDFTRSFILFNEQPMVPLLMLDQALKKIDALFVPFQNDLSKEDEEGQIVDPMLIDFSELLRSVVALHMVDLASLDATLLKDETGEALKQALASRLSRFGADFNQIIVKDERGWTLRVDAERIYLEMQIAQVTKSSA